MNSTRIEILKNDEWISLFLSNNEQLKFNVVINKIGEVATREISHSNTFSLVPDWNTTQALDLNQFNKKDLAKALNKKYEAKYYVDEKILKVGYLIINNTNAGKINVNFIGEGLDLVEQWGEITFQGLLRSNTLAIPADYQTAIDELRQFNLGIGVVITKTNDIPGRGHRLCYFPNNLNTIGDKFQLNDAGVRVDDVFNPYQSRPIFNAKSLFDLATLPFGYTPIYDDSVEWSIVFKTLIVSGGLNTSEKETGVIEESKDTFMSSSNYPYYKEVLGSNGFGTLYGSNVAFLFSGGVSERPNVIDGWSAALPILSNFDGTVPTYFDKPIVYIPELDSGLVGDINVQADIVFGNTDQQFLDAGTASVYQSVFIIGIWENATVGGNTFMQVSAQSFTDDSDGSVQFPTPVDTNLTRGVASLVDVTFNKSIFNSPPGGSGDFIGFAVVVRRAWIFDPNIRLENLIVSESFLPSGTITFDDFGQYNPTTVDLTHGAPLDSIKSLLSSLMHKEGILMNISDTDKTVNFFSYGAYQTARENDEFLDWSKYFLKYSEPQHSTNFGNDYAKKNQIGLASPFPGNTSDVFLNNQGDASKYKDFTKNLSQLFKDVENVRSIGNTTTPYIEYVNKGLGLVEHQGVLGTLTQARANGNTQGTFSGLFEIVNVNGSVVARGVKEWYRLVDEAIRINAEFTLPVQEFISFDISKPIFVDRLHGFYIIEEISEYIDDTKPVTIKLIKLIDNLKI